MLFKTQENRVVKITLNKNFAKSRKFEKMVALEKNLKKLVP